MTDKRATAQSVVVPFGKERMSLEISKALKDAYERGAPAHLPEELQVLVDRIAGQKCGKQ